MRNILLGLFRSQRLSLAASACALALAVGCEKPGNSSPVFLLNNQGLDPDEFIVLSTDDEEAKKTKEEIKIPGRQYTANALEAMFGTPDQPFVFRESGLDFQKVFVAAGRFGGMTDAARVDALTTLEGKQKEVKKKLEDEYDPEAKKFAALAAPAEAELKTARTQLDAAKKASDAAQVATLEQKIKDLQPTIVAKVAAEGKVAVAKGTIEDLDMQIAAYRKSDFQAGLYRQHCVHCHGVNGDGAGPTALFLNPYPRDYRLGKFKFKSTANPAKPTHADLMRILVDGIPDTAMPSFRLLKPDELEALVEYVKYLAIRGEAEYRLREATKSDKLEPQRSVLVETALAGAVESWKGADETVVVPKAAYVGPTDEASRKAWLDAGKTLFLGEKAKCSTCHGTTGLGDGRNSKPFYDDWNKPKFEAAEALKAAIAAVSTAKTPEQQAAAKLNVTSQRHIAESWLLPLQQQYPRNLRLNRIRFGREPLDLYRRIYAGISGTEMPGFGQALTETEIWQLVDYVRELPFYVDGEPSKPSADPHGHDGHGHADHGHTARAPSAQPVAGANLAGNE